MKKRMIMSSLQHLLIALLVLFPAAILSQSSQTLLNEAVDLSKDFKDYTNTYFVADSLKSFDPTSASGEIIWRRSEYYPAHAFDYEQHGLKRISQNEFPSREYAADPAWPFHLEFVSPKTVRVVMTSGKGNLIDDTLMIPHPVSKDGSWVYSKLSNGYQYKSQFGAVRVYDFPWGIEFFDATGKSLTKTRSNSDNKGFCANLPFCYVRRAADYSRSFGAVFTLSPEEKIFGCGESFTKLNKYGQKVNLYTCDPNGVETPFMYKPIPFFMSSKGYGMFMHTSTPVTCDFGNSYGAANALLIGDEALDLFVFLGKPKEILDEYTDLTGKASMPPLWSFGLWMSRITYFSEKDGRDVAAKLRANRIPSDVLHFDTGWFETDWRCDYEFSKNRFPDAKGMIADLKSAGFRTCLWQLPYFVPKNKLFPEIVDKGLQVKNNKGNTPFEDAVLDFTNPETIEWYKTKIKGLLDLGVAAIKVDFGEAAPYNGIYANGRTGFYEHNLYPLRYNKIVSDLTHDSHDERIIWARSAWAGSQRYPLHWGGDAETSDMGMEAQLRGGLSLGLSGFSFWSHDIGGFTKRTPENLYRRWLPFGALSSHSRCHGQPPKEPWDYGIAFQDYFRKTIELKYQLMPYIYAQSKLATIHGWPMTRALFVEFPEDRGSWEIENEYMFGSDILVAPIFEEGQAMRNVYLPTGKWIDYQSGKVYSSGWNQIAPGAIESIIMVKDGSILPHIKIAQSTKDMDWSDIDLKVYSTGDHATCSFVLPDKDQVEVIGVNKKGSKYMLSDSPKGLKSKFNVIQVSTN